MTSPAMTALDHMTLKAAKAAQRARYASDLQSVYHHILHLLEVRAGGHPQHESAFWGDSLAFREARDYLIGNASVLSNGYALADTSEPVRTVGSTDRSWAALVTIAQAQLVLVAEVEELLQVDGYTGLTWEAYRSDSGSMPAGEDRGPSFAERRHLDAQAARKARKPRTLDRRPLTRDEARELGLRHDDGTLSAIQPGCRIRQHLHTEGTYQGFLGNSVSIDWDRKPLPPRECEAWQLHTLGNIQVTEVGEENMYFTQCRTGIRFFCKVG